MLGIKAKAYRNTGNYSSPTWNEVDNISDFTVDPKWTFADVMIRATRVKMVSPTMLECPITGRMLKDATSADYDAFNNAFRAGTALDLLILDGPNNTNTSDGVRGYFHIEGWTENQGADQVIYKDFGLTPALPTDGNYLKFATVTNSALVYTDPG